MDNGGWDRKETVDGLDLEFGNGFGGMKAGRRDYSGDKMCL